MSIWLDGSEISNIWGTFKTKLAENLLSLSGRISQNSSDISDRVTKSQFGIMNAFRYKSTDIFSNTASDIYKYLYSNYAYGYSSYSSNNYRKTITRDGRIFEWDCANRIVVEINPTTGEITKYNMAVYGNAITYMWYIGTYVDGDDIYTYLWGTDSSGYGIFKVKHGDESYASSVTSLSIYNIAQYPEYYSSPETTPVYSTSTSYFRTLLSVLIGDTVYIICNTYTSYSRYYPQYDIYFSWDGTHFDGTDSTKPKKLTVDLPTYFYNSQYYHYEKGSNLATDNDVTYSDSYKFSISLSSGNSVTLKAEQVIPYMQQNSNYSNACGFYNDYVVFHYARDGHHDTLMFVPINDISYYEIIPFKDPYDNTTTQYYNRLIFTHLENGTAGKNYVFYPKFNCINGYSGSGVVLKNLDE